MEETMTLGIAFVAGALAMCPPVIWLHRRRCWWSEQACKWLRRTIELELMLVAKLKSQKPEDEADWWKT